MTDQNDCEIYNEKHKEGFETLYFRGQVQQPRLDVFKEKLQQGMRLLQVRS